MADTGWPSCATSLKGVILDMCGVLYDSGEGDGVAIPGSVEAVRRWVLSGTTENIWFEASFVCISSLNTLADLMCVCEGSKLPTWSWDSAPTRRKQWERSLWPNFKDWDLTFVSVRSSLLRLQPLLCFGKGGCGPTCWCTTVLSVHTRSSRVICID